PIANAGNDVAICIGSSTQLNACGGVGYSWSPSTGLSSLTISNPVANPVVNTTYVVVVSDATSCLDDDTVIVTIKPLPIANAGNDTAICLNSQGQLHASGGINYAWHPAATLSAANIYNPVASPV